MSRIPCFSEPANDVICIIKRWQIEFCRSVSSDEKVKVIQCAAAVLSFFIYWHEVKLDIRAKSSKLNDVAQRHGDARVHDESLLQFHTYEEIKTGILDFFSVSTIQKAIQLLVKADVITLHRNPNPRYSYDRTTFYLVNIQTIKDYLKTYNSQSVFIPTRCGTDTKSSRYKKQMETVKIPNSIGIDNRTIPETTPEITTEKAAAKEEARSQHRASLPQHACAAAFSCDTQLPATPEHIGDKLTLAQITHIKSKLSGLTTDSVTTPAILQHAVITSLLDPQQFTGCHPHFAKKLNAIIKCFREGRYSPSDVLAQKRQAHDAQSAQHNQQRLGELMHSYRELQGDIHHFEEILRDNLPVDEITPMLPVYADKQRMLIDLKTEIDGLNEAMGGQNSANLSEIKNRTDLARTSTDLSTELPTKNVDNAEREQGGIERIQPGEGVC